jgi:hypothetical protein
MIHLVNDFPYTTTMCGLPLSEVGEDWTDAIVEICDDPEGACTKCVKLARVEIRKIASDGRHEMAMEAGMLHGIDAYNEMMGY